MTSPRRKLQAGDPFPLITIEDERGENIKLFVEKQRPKLIVFYRGSFCRFCAGSLNEMNNQADTLRNAGVDLIAVSADDTDTSGALSKELGLKFPLACGLKRSHMDSLGLKISSAGTTARHSTCCEVGSGYCQGPGRCCVGRCRGTGGGTRRIKSYDDRDGFGNFGPGISLPGSAANSGHSVSSIMSALTEGRGGGGAGGDFLMSISEEGIGKVGSGSGKTFCTLGSASTISTTTGSGVAPSYWYCEPAHFFLNPDNTIKYTFQPDDLYHI